MDIAKAVIEFGTLAVKRYNEISGAKQDNEVPEAFLGPFIVSRLYDEFRPEWTFRIERNYRDIANELGLEIPPKVEKSLSGRADVAGYKNGIPSALIELKIYDERSGGDSPILDDFYKVEKLVSLCKSNLQRYVGAMICDTATGGIKVKVAPFEEALGRRVSRGKRIFSRDDAWEWCFVCALL
jgi:hypothetical protein